MAKYVIQIEGQFEIVMFKKKKKIVLYFENNQLKDKAVERLINLNVKVI